MQVYSFIFLGMLFFGLFHAVSKIHEDLKWIMIYLLNDMFRCIYVAMKQNINVYLGALDLVLISQLFYSEKWSKNLPCWWLRLNSFPGSNSAVHHGWIGAEKCFSRGPFSGAVLISVYFRTGKKQTLPDSSHELACKVYRITSNNFT